MRKFTEKEITDALVAVVAERGEDYVYPRDEPGWRSRDGGICVYAVNGDPDRPACIIGAVLHHLDALTPRVAEYLGPVTQLVAHHMLDVSRETHNALREAQRIQDVGGTWGTALAAYKRELAA